MLEREFIEVGYFLSRLGVDSPPSVLETSTWKEAYLKFYSRFGIGKTEDEFRNSLKNLRDHFDGHLENKRVGWRDNHEAQSLSSKNKEVFNELQKISDDDLWKRIQKFIVEQHLRQS